MPAGLLQVKDGVFSNTEDGTLPGCAVEAMRSVAEAGRLALASEAPEQPLAVQADPERVQLVAKIIANAVRHTPPGGRIDVSARVGWVQISSDNGVLLAFPWRPSSRPLSRDWLLEEIGHGNIEQAGEMHERDDREVLVAPFDALEVLHREVSLGSERLLCKACPGSELGDTPTHVTDYSLWVGGPHPTANAVSFLLYETPTSELPLLVCPEAARGEEECMPATTRPHGNSARQLILVVDDDRETRDVLKEALEGAGYGVLTAANGVAALSRMQANPALALLVLDLHMPVMNGWQVLEAMARNPMCLSIPVVVASGSDEVPRGVSAVLKKPFGQDDLLDVVGRCLTATSIAEGAIGIPTCESDPIAGIP